MQSLPGFLRDDFQCSEDQCQMTYEGEVVGFKTRLKSYLSGVSPSSPSF